MTSPLHLDSKVPTPTGAALGVMSPVAIDFESLATAPRGPGPVDTKRSFASLLGNAKKDLPTENRLPQVEKSSRPAAPAPAPAPAPKEPTPHLTLTPKPKFKETSRAPAAEPRSRPTSDSSRPTQPVAKEENSATESKDSEEADSDSENKDTGATESSTPVVAVQALPVKDLTPVTCGNGENSSELTSAPTLTSSTSELTSAPTLTSSISDQAVAETPSAPALAAVASATVTSESVRSALVESTQVSKAQAVSTQELKQSDQGFELEVNPEAQAAADKLDFGAAERVTTAKKLATTAEALPLPKELIAASRVEKTAASSVSAVSDGAKIAASGIFNNIENTGNNNFKKVEPVVGLSAAPSGAAMSSTLLDLFEASRTDVPASEAVSRVNLAQVVDEVAVISEKMRVSGQHRCVVDFDVAGHGSLRVEVVRRDDQLKTMFSTESESLRESLQAAFANSDRPGQMSTSFDWQGSSPDSSGQGQSGAQNQADADSRQTTYFKTESVSRTSALSSAPTVSSEPIEAPALPPHHRLQLFA
ncbi:MAG: hypothetical protein WCG63_02635 [Opitutaceae bacterium]